MSKGLFNCLDGKVKCVDDGNWCCAVNEVTAISDKANEIQKAARKTAAAVGFPVDKVGSKGSMCMLKSMVKDTTTENALYAVTYKTYCSGASALAGAAAALATAVFVNQF